MAISGTQELIQAITVASGGSANIEFTNIPATYDDLKIVISGRIVSGNDGTLSLSFNGSTSNFSYKRLIGDGLNASSYGDVTNSLGFLNRSDTTASMFGNTEIYISNYRSNNNKSISIDSAAENGATTAFLGIWAGLWSNSASIASVRISGASNISEHSTATLYGITRIPSAAKAAGGVITQDSTYWYHTFTSSGVFTPTQSITADYIVVAGGGGAANGYFSGGGGAGGFRSLTSQSLTAQAYTVTIGAGGTDSNGSNSVFGSTTATAGGRGGGGYGPSDSRNSGSAGGSGGGGSAGNSPYGGTGAAGNAGSYSPVEGYAGGNGSNQGSAGTNIGGGGGGGGAGGAGGNGNVPSNTGGAGGIGTYSSLTNAMGAATSTGQLSGGNYYFGGGGGGGQERTGSSPAVTAGPAGLGGGGIGGIRGLSAPGNGTPNTGGGGGGSGGDSFATGGSGGSGIVIVRYAK